jgi:hypothetical protein
LAQEHGEPYESYGTQVLMLVEEGGSFTAYDHCVGPSNYVTVTQWSGYLGGGFEQRTGLLKDYAARLYTYVTVTLEASTPGLISGTCP